MSKIFDLPDEELQRLGATLIAERNTAASAQSRTKLENVWAKARRQYQTGSSMELAGDSSKLEKGATLDGPLTAFKEEDTKQGSTVSVNITRPYTNAGTAQVANILLPTGRLPFKLEATKVSDLEALRGVLENYPQLQNVLADLAPEIAKKLATPEDESKVALEIASKLIHDWLEETNFPGAVRTQLTEAGQVGTGVLKGPFPKSRRITAEINELLDKLPEAFGEEGIGLLLQSELRTLLAYAPSVESIKVENCYPDADCGTDIQNGRFFYERVTAVTMRQLREHQKEQSYDTEQIEACISEDPKIHGESKSNKNGPYEFWIRTGLLEATPEGGEMQSFGFQVTVLCNERIIKSESYWLEDTKFPYWFLCWEPREGSYAGIGIPEQIETPQRGLNSSVRALMDNMAYSVGPQILEQEGVIEPDDGNWKPYPYKRWKITSSLPGVDAVVEAKQALVFLEFPNYLNEIMPVISWWLKMAEDTTGLSLLLQGKAVTDAVGVSQQLMANATTNLRLVIKEWDDKVCRPLITGFYQWVQQYGPDTAYGDAVVKPLGSAALIVRELQQQALLQIGDKVIQPIYGKSPKKWMNMYLEGFQVDPSQLDLEDDERAQLEAAANEKDVKVVVAEIQAESNRYRADLKVEFDELQLSIESSLKALTEENAVSTGELNAQVKVFQELLKVGQTPDNAGAAPPAAAPAAPAMPAMPAPQQNTDVNAALDILEQ
jgi:hypothetical protein